MADPVTSNILLSVPTRGSDPGTWDLPLNNNSSALDGLLGGSVTVSLSNIPVTLSAPAGVVTAGAGPFQSQNRILKFTGTLTSNVPVTLPLPGEYTIQNLTTGNFVVTFVSAGGGKIISTPQGSIMKIFNDGTDVWLIKNQIPGALTFLGGVSVVPTWIVSCTVAPFLLCDGTVYNFSTFPALGNLYVGNFGGNGITTFAVEDLRGRVPLAYDGTGTRITVAGCGINGQTLGAAGGGQNGTIANGNLPANIPNTLSATFAPTSGGSPVFVGSAHSISNATGGSGADIPTRTTSIVLGGTVAITGAINGSGANTPLPIVQPSQVAGIWLVAT